MVCLSCYLLWFLFNKIRKDGGTGSAGKLGVGRGRGEVAQTIYTHVNKCKNDKKKKRLNITISQNPIC
jgi:hypothetical protein